MPRPRRSRRAAATTAHANPEPANDGAPPSNSEIENSTSARLGRSRKGEAHGRTTSIDGITSQAEKKALARASKERDVAMRRLSLEDVTTSSSTGNNATVAAPIAARKHDDDGRYDSSVEFGRKAAATPVHAHRHDTTGLELDDDVFDALDDSLDMDGEDDLQLHREAPASGQRSADTSSLTASILKRRGRAPSISLHGNDSAPIRPSSRAGATTPLVSSSFNIGVFQRRAREPSILGTAQKESAQKAVEGSPEVASSDEEEEDERDEKSIGGGNISPQVEQTPLARRKTRTRSAVGGQPDEVEPQASSSAKSRKRKSIEADEADEASERPQKALRADDQSEPEDVDVDVDTGADALLAAEEGEEGVLSDSSSLSSLPSPELPPLQAPRRPSTPINQSDIMAPPESSSSEAEDAWPNMRSGVPGGAGKRSRDHGRATTPLHAGNVSDVSSPPSLTHSPNYAPARRSRLQQQREDEHQRKSSKQRSEQVTTADLAGLLPRRRHRNPAAAEAEHPSSDAALDASGLGRDQDELSYLDARARRRRGRTTPLERRGGGGVGEDNAGGAGTTKAKGKGGSSSRPASGRPSKTYGRRSSDKENQSGNDGEGDGSFSPAPDDTFDATGEEGTGEVAEELRNAVKKFQEVDRWQMEFEEMTQSSSPVGGR